MTSVSLSAQPLHIAFKSRVVPVVVLSSAEQALPLCQALLDGGIDVIEITLRSDAALAAISAVARQLPAMHLGAGTVRNPHELQQVIDAGAQFALSPGCTPALAQVAIEKSFPFIPGVMTASEVLQARDHGFRLMELFPANLAGGIDMLRALAAPIPDVRFCPTGGVHADNLAQYLALPNVAMVGGSWLTPANALSAGDYAHITKLAAQASKLTADADAAVN